MAQSEPAKQFITFFKALADPNRLKIVGLLAHRPQSVEELAANLGISSGTVSHHLQRLQKANLVQAHVESYYNVYALRAEVLRQMAERLLTPDAIKATTTQSDLDTYSTQVLNEYWVRGRLKSIPSQLIKREIVLRRLVREFEEGRRYSEKRVNEILKVYYADYARLRTELLNLNLLAQEKGHYSRVG
jgi:biotin operon repressor